MALKLIFELSINAFIDDKSLLTKFILTMKKKLFITILYVKISLHIIEKISKNKLNSMRLSEILHLFAISISQRNTVKSHLR